MNTTTLPCGPPPYSVSLLAATITAHSAKNTILLFSCREAKKLFGSSPSKSTAGVKTLSEILNEYVRLKSLELQREALRQSNPVVQTLYNALDFHAGLPTQPIQPVYPPIQQQQMAEQPMAAPEQAPAAYMPNGQQIIMTNGGGADLPPPQGMVPVSDLGGMGQDTLNESMPFEKPVQFTSPGRHALRKRAPPKRKRAPPKRRKLETAFNPDDGPAGGSGPMLPMISSPGGGDINSHHNQATDFYNQTMDPHMLEALLTDAPLQNKFAHGMAQRLTEVMNQRPDGSADSKCFNSLS